MKIQCNRLLKTLSELITQNLENQIAQKTHSNTHTKSSKTGEKKESSSPIHTKTNSQSTNLKKKDNLHKNFKKNENKKFQRERDRMLTHHPRTLQRRIENSRERERERTYISSMNLAETMTLVMRRR